MNPRNHQSQRNKERGDRQVSTDDLNDDSTGYWVLPIPQRAPMSGHYFGGPSISEEGHFNKTFILDTNGPLMTKDLKLPDVFAESYEGGCQQACTNIANKFANTTGGIYIKLCKCVDPAASHAGTLPKDHQVARLSGFWIEGGRFVTCAHFLDILQLSELQKANTVAYLKSEESSLLNDKKAIVSTGIKIAAEIECAVNTVPVYLLKLDRNSDLAIFKLYDDSDNTYEPTCVLRDDIGSQARHDKSQGLFTIGYYGTNALLEGLTTEDRSVIERFWPDDNDTKPKTYFPVKYAGVVQKRDDTVQFNDVFEHPHYRTISMGKLSTTFSNNQLSNFVSCDMSAWFGSSGGMVGGFCQDRSGNGKGWKPMIFGVLRGDHGRENAVVTFTEKGKDWLFD